MAKAKAIPDLTSDVPYAEAAAKIVTVRGEELAEHAQGVLDTGDIERVHDMRVATRRLRAALEIFEPCFPAKLYGAGARRGEEASRTPSASGATATSPSRPCTASTTRWRRRTVGASSP